MSEISPKEEPQLRHIAPSASERANSSEMDWPEFAKRADIPYGEPVVVEALTRLRDGDVSSTRHGIRVEVRPDLEDYRPSGASAYWPRWNSDGYPHCACRDASAYGPCSHLWAARIYYRWLEERLEESRRTPPPETAERRPAPLVSTYFKNKPMARPRRR